MKLLMILTVLLTSITFQACKPKKAEVKTDDDKTFYVVGHMFGSRLNNLNLSDQELDFLKQGLADSARGVKPSCEVAKYQPNVQKMFKDRISQSSKKVKEEGGKYIEKFIADGAKKTKSGLAYKIIKDGKGKKPKETDKVEVHYHGTLINGTVFDSSVDRGKTVEFPLNRVIKGWTEGLQLIGEGGKIKLVIPSELAYGDNGAPPKIPGGATLIFDVELFKINKEAPKKAKKKK